MKKIVPLVLSAVALLSTHAATAETSRARLDTSKMEEQSTIRDAREVYSELVKNNSLPDDVFGKAACVVVVPKMISAALVVGGSHGDAVASCKTGANTWSDPAFVDLTSASLGAQIGGKSTDMVIFLTNNKAEKSLKNGKFVLGADASVLAGTFDKGWRIPEADAVVYQRSSGAFIGASIDGLNLSVDKESNQALYGKNVEASSILDGKTTSSNPDIAAFKNILPTA